MENQTNPLDQMMSELAAQGNASSSISHEQEDHQEEENDNVQVESDSEEPNEVGSSSQEVESESKTPEESTSKDKDDEVSDWDLEDSDNASEQPETNVYKEFEEVLGLSNPDKGSVIQEIKKLKEDYQRVTKTLEETKSQTPFANDMISKANEIAKNGGDYLAYLGATSVDYDNVPDEALIEHKYAAYFENDEDPQAEFQDFLASKSDREKRIIAQEVRNDFKNSQEQAKRQIEQEVIQKRKSLDEGITKHLETTSAIFGLKINPSHKKQIYGDIESGKLINDVYYKPDGTYNFQAMAEFSFFKNNRDKIFKLIKDKTSNEVKRDEFRKLSNVEVTKKSSPVKEQTPMTGIERMMQEYKSKTF